MVRKAKAITPIPNLGLYKQEVLLLLRLYQHTEAIEALKEYMSMLSEFKAQSENSDDIQLANEELRWGSKLYKTIH